MDTPKGEVRIPEFERICILVEDDAKHQPQEQRQESDAF